jgi:predicted DNA binding CopG/RHH family protein
VLKSESDVFKNFVMYATENFKKETELNKYLQYYKENFTKIILAAMKHYTRFYKKNDASTISLIKSIATTNGIPYYCYCNTIIKFQEKQYNLNKKIIEEMIFRLYAQLIII